jgi:hypothetical protein
MRMVVWSVVNGDRSDGWLSDNFEKLIMLGATFVSARNVLAPNFSYVTVITS